MRSRSAHHSRCGQRMSPNSSTVGSSPSPSSQICRCSAQLEILRPFFAGRLRRFWQNSAEFNGVHWQEAELAAAQLITAAAQPRDLWLQISWYQRLNRSRPSWCWSSRRYGLRKAAGRIGPCSCSEGQCSKMARQMPVEPGLLVAAWRLLAYSRPGAKCTDDCVSHSISYKAPAASPSLSSDVRI